MVEGTGQIHAMIRDAARSVGGDHGIPAPAQARSSLSAAQLEEHGRASYADALEACRLLSAGRTEAAQLLARRALAHRQAWKHATAGYAQEAQRHTGRYFEWEVLSVRDYAEDGEDYTQWYFRLMLIWHEDGQQLVVANAPELEASTGMEVGEGSWRALCRWIEEHSSPEGRANRGRPVEDDAHLIFLDNNGHLRPRRFVQDRYSGLLDAFSCLRRAMIWKVDELPELQEREARAFEIDWDDDTPGEE
ncbi:hypothetical protein EHF33_20635 (plasmid) [Deinococcus psychrotolerans]|uniref:Uncharacterized protein n=1 Tax=Deinococcus psychrotolerans TaxID=2489213 RepID=A0A3G8YJ83_9DEIO|nr:hypothetical protein [Deinococcus psychrotolerans]AZI45319.1 hypothetical protein EHF33_20635 [Deinococcus psychrotolerans]